jgi:hypothetical protein
MTILEALINSVSYPVDNGRVEAIAIKRQLYTPDEFTYEVSQERSYRLAEADVKVLVATSPNVSDGEVSISQSEQERLVSLANAVYSEFGENTAVPQQPTIQHLEGW